MLSIEELAREVASIKATSEQLSTMVGTANVALSKQAGWIANIVRGSKTGQDAVMALSVATRSLADAATSMRTLGHTCEMCIQNLTK